MLQNIKPGLLKLFGLLLQIHSRERFWRAGQKQLHQFPVIVLPHLLGYENAARFQDTVHFPRIIISMTVYYHVKTAVRKGQRLIPRRLPEINSQGRQKPPAQLCIGRICLCGAGSGVWMAQ